MSAPTKREQSDSPFARVPRRYRKKPVEVEAMFFDAYTSAFAPYPPMPEGGEMWRWLTEGDCQFSLSSDPNGRAFLRIHTLEGVMRADIGDYIIRGVRGEHYPCKADIFDETYERVES